MTETAPLAQPGDLIAVRVTPRASRNLIWQDGTTLRASVTAAPDKGKANDAVTRLLAEHLGVAPSRLVLVRGATARDKLFRLR